MGNKLRERTKFDDNGKEIKKPTRYASSKQEKQVAKQVNGMVTKNSGATLFDKGDIKANKFLIECKTKMSSSKSISIKKEWIEKLKQEALFSGKEYEALIFNFGPDEENYAIIDMYLFQTLLDAVSNEH